MRETSVKIYILGLRDNFRGNHLYEFLKMQNFKVEIFWGYSKEDSRELNPFSDSRKSKFLYARNLTWSEIACAAGHRKILEKALHEDIDCVLVLEDDVIVNDPDWLRSQIEASASSSFPSLVLLLTDVRLSLTGRFKSQNSKLEHLKRIHSNPSPAAAYLFNRAALDRIRGLPESNWYGSQADFPPILSKELVLLDASTHLEPYPIALAEVSSTMSSSRNKEITGLNYALWYLHKILFFGYFQGRTYGLDLKTYFYHFIGRRLAWKIHQDGMPVQRIHP